MGDINHAQKFIREQSVPTIPSAVQWRKLEEGEAKTPHLNTWMWKEINRILMNIHAHHLGATCRLLYVPKAHTSARPLCRKTSLLSDDYGVSATVSANAEWMAAGTTESEQRARRRRTDQPPSIAQYMYMQPVWKVINATETMSCMLAHQTSAKQFMKLLHASYWVYLVLESHSILSRKKIRKNVIQWHFSVAMALIALHIPCSF